MFKRWLIRGVFLFTLVICVGGWVVSEQYNYGFSYLGRNLWGVTCNRGKFQLQWWEFSLNTSRHELSGHVGPAFDLPPEFFAQFDNYQSYLGFFMTNGSTTKLIIIPFAFPLLLYTPLLWLVWRQTRPQPSPAMAFPVETNKGGS